MTYRTTYRTIPGALDRINRLMRQRKLAPLDPTFTPTRAAKEQQRFYMTPVHDRGQVIWFKASLQNAPGLSRSLHHEITMQRSFRDYEARYHPPFLSPSFIAAGGSPDWRWLLRKYWQGDFAGSMDDSFGLTGAFVRRVSPARMAHVIASVGKMSSFMRRRLTIPVHDAGWYGLDFRYYQQHYFQHVTHHALNPGWTPAMVRRWYRYLGRSKTFLHQHATVLSHGDLYPNNIMILGTPEHTRVVLFDWELANWNLPTFDATMVWLMAWRHPKWQKSFRQSIEHRLGDSSVMRQSWNLSSLSLLTRLSAFTFLRLTGLQPERYPTLPKKHRAVMRRMWLHMSRRLTDLDSLLYS